MDQKFVRELLKLDSTAQVVRKLLERRDEILQGIEAGTIEPSHEVIAELAELSIALGEVEAGNG